MKARLYLAPIALALPLTLAACASEPAPRPAPPAKRTAERPAPAAASEPLHLGRHSYRVSTTSPEAQKAFDRGLTLAYAFHYGAAEKEFREAARLDPSLAMAWWGVSLVNG